MHLLVKERSMNHEISVYETTQLYGETGKFRFLQFSDHAVQGAIDLNDPQRIVLEYPRAIIHMMKFNQPLFNNVFVIGHGIGTIAGHFSDKRFTVAEIDEKVVELSKSFFGYLPNNVSVGDGRQLLGNEDDHTLDYIILDAFTKKGTPYHLTTSGFFELTGQKLTSQGALIMNLMGKSRNDQLINAIHTTLGETFAHSKVFSLPADKGTDIRNMLVVGSNKNIEFQTRDMAGFVEIELSQGYIIHDQDPKIAE